MNQRTPDDKSTMRGAPRPTTAKAVQDNREATRFLEQRTEGRTVPHPRVENFHD